MDILKTEGTVGIVDFSPDGRYLLTRRFDPSVRSKIQLNPGAGLEDPTVLNNREDARIWDTSTGSELWRFKLSLVWQRLDSGVMRFSPDSKLLAIARKNSVQIVQTASGKERITIKNVPAVESVAFAADSGHLVTTSTDNFARVWDEGGKEVARMGDLARTDLLACSPKTPLIATANAGNVVKVWRADNAANVAEIHHGGPVTCLAFSPDGQLLASGSDDKTAQVHDVLKNRVVATFKHFGRVSYVAFSPDSKLLATLSSDGTGRIWDVRAREEMTIITSPTGVLAIAFSPDSRYAITGEGDGRKWGEGTARLWPIRSMDLIKQASARITRPLTDEERAFDAEP